MAEVLRKLHPKIVRTTDVNRSEIMMFGEPSLSSHCIQSVAAALFTILLIVCDFSNALISTIPGTTTVRSSKQKHPPLPILLLVQYQRLPRSRSKTLSSISSTTEESIDEGHWVSLIDDTNNNNNNNNHSWKSPPVRKCILSEGTTGNIPSEEEDSIIELQYTGTLLGERHHWSTIDVVQCWLSQLQGLEDLVPKFIEHEIDGGKLMDESYFTEQFCMETLGMENKIQAKKLVMAARRLTRQQEEYPSGTVFDSSAAAREGSINYTFVLKTKGRCTKVIPAMELAVRSMKLGERSKLICRSDYAYGAEGLRSSKGQVIVPPFAMLCFDLTLVNIS